MAFHPTVEYVSRKQYFKQQFCKVVRNDYLNINKGA